MGKVITWDSKRELRNFDYDISEYYRKLSNYWNKLSNHITEPKDRRTNYFYAYTEFFWALVYMWDMIIQTQNEYKSRIHEQSIKIQALENELRKWTEQQHGRKPILTAGQIQQVHEWKQNKISNREIARRLHVSEGTIRNALKREKAGN